MTTVALLLNADYRPIKVISWVRAVCLFLDDKVELVEAYVDQAIRTASATLPRPAVVRLRRFVRLDGRVRFSRQNVLARDGYRCCYCGVRPRLGDGPDLESLTIDHVIPRARSRDGRVWLPWRQATVPVTCWENVVTACAACNFRKADGTLARAGMKLAAWPRAPSSMDVLRMSLVQVHIPEEWKTYLPQESAWRDYWTAEIAED